MTEETKEELIEEIKLLQKRIAELEKLYVEIWDKHQYTRRYETVVRDSNDSIIIQDLEGRITAWNLGAEKMYGYKEEEVLGMNIERLTPPRKAVEHKELTRRLLAGEIVDSFETQRVTKGGSILDVWMTITKIIEYPEDSIISTGRDITKPTGIALIERNITERKRMEEALRESEEKYRSLFESSRDAHMTIEPPSWRFTSANSSMLRMFKVNNEAEFLLHTPWSLSPERQPDGRLSSEKAKEMIETALRNDGTNLFEWTHKRSSGETFPAEILLTKVEIKEKIFLLAAIRDITQRKKAEEEMQKRLQELETFYKTSLGKEKRIIELEEEVKCLKNKLKK